MSKGSERKEEIGKRKERMSYRRKGRFSRGRVGKARMREGRL